MTTSTTHGLNNPDTWPVRTLFTLAWRNLWRNHRRTLIMLAAIAVGVWAMIFMTALMRGMVDDMLQRGIDDLPGHVQIHHPDFLDDPSIVNSIPEPSDALLGTLNTPPVTRWYSRLKVPAVISSERSTRGITLLGVDPERETDTLFRIINMDGGHFLSATDDRGVVIGARLAERLETRLGKRIVITSQDPDNNLSEIGARIVGVFKAELPSQEEAFLYLGKQTLQHALNVSGLVSEIAVFGADETATQPVFEHVAQSAAQSSHALSVQSWTQLNGFLSSTVSVMDGFILIWIVVIFIALSFGLANTLVMAIFERVREIGLMLALGMRPKFVLLQILMESVLLLVLGLLIGNGLTVLSVMAMGDGIDLSAVAKGFEMAGMGTNLYPVLLPKDVLSANVVVIVLGLLTSLLPAFRAARYDPIRALSKPT